MVKRTVGILILALLALPGRALAQWPSTKANQVLESMFTQDSNFGFPPYAAQPFACSVATERSTYYNTTSKLNMKCNGTVWSAFGETSRLDFERSSAQMVVLFTTPYAADPAAAGLYRIPRLVIVYKPAGDAYTVPGTSDIRIQSSTGGVWAQIETTGFLDQTTAQSRAVLMPSSASGAFYAAVGSAAHDGFFLAITTANITPGAASPALKFRIYYDDHLMIW